jgi:hypothetical protein
MAKYFDKDQTERKRPTDSDKEELWRQSVRTMQTARAPAKKTTGLKKGGMVRGRCDYAK